MRSKMDGSTNTNSLVNIIGFGKKKSQKYTCSLCNEYFIKHKEIPIGITKIGKKWIYDDSISERHCVCMLIIQLKKKIHNLLVSN